MAAGIKCNRFRFCFCFCLRFGLLWFVFRFFFYYLFPCDGLSFSAVLLNKTICLLFRFDFKAFLLFFLCLSVLALSGCILVSQLTSLMRWIFVVLFRSLSISLSLCVFVLNKFFTSPKQNQLLVYL